MLMFRKAALFLCMTLCFICNAMAQGYDDNFEKPIVSEDGKFRYYELPAIKTTEVIDQYDPQWIILCGWAGAYPESGLSIGDCVSVDSEFEADLGTLRDGKFIVKDSKGNVVSNCVYKAGILKK